MPNVYLTMMQRYRNILRMMDDLQSDQSKCSRESHINRRNELLLYEYSIGMHFTIFYIYLNQSINKILLLILVANSFYIYTIETAIMFEFFYIFQPFIIISINITFEDLYVSKFFLHHFVCILKKI